LYNFDAQKRKPPLALASAFPAHAGADLWQAVGDVDLGRKEFRRDMFERHGFGLRLHATDDAVREGDAWR
jgi:hypothetical protein